MKKHIIKNTIKKNETTEIVICPECKGCGKMREYYTDGTDKENACGMCHGEGRLEQTVTSEIKYKKINKEIHSINKRPIKWIVE